MLNIFVSGIFIYYFNKVVGNWILILKSIIFLKFCLAVLLAIASICLFQDRRKPTKPSMLKSVYSIKCCIKTFPSDEPSPLSKHKLTDASDCQCLYDWQGENVYPSLYGSLRHPHDTRKPSHPATTNDEWWRTPSNLHISSWKIKFDKDKVYPLLTACQENIWEDDCHLVEWLLHWTVLWNNRSSWTSHLKK